MRSINKKGQRAVTLTELLVVLAIIGLLATIAVPVYVSKMEQAKIVTAKHEVRELADAEEICGILHGYYVPLCMLDDLPYRSSGRPPRVDDVENTANILDPYLIDVAIPILEQRGNQKQLGSNRNDTPSVGKLYFGWQGPFINFKRYYMGQGIYTEPATPTNDRIAQDYPLDPWGNPYLMATERGLVTLIGQIPSPDVTLEHSFDRMAILSLGPDGTTTISGSNISFNNPSGTDDIWVYFCGAIRPETVY